MISNAGRIVWAVVCTAPETMPSASPRCTMSVPKYDTSVTVSAACAYVTPLCARRRSYSWANRATWTGSNGESTSAALDVDPQLDRARAHLERLAEDHQVGDAALEHRAGGAQHAVVATLGQHDPLAHRRGRAR